MVFFHVLVFNLYDSNQKHVTCGTALFNTQYQIIFFEGLTM